jgi:hypothetical protein
MIRLQPLATSPQYHMKGNNMKITIKTFLLVAIVSVTRCHANELPYQNSDPTEQPLHRDGVKEEVKTRLQLLSEQAAICDRYDSFIETANGHIWKKGWDICSTVVSDLTIEIEKQDHAEMDALRKETVTEGFNTVVGNVILFKEHSEGGSECPKRAQ